MALDLSDCQFEGPALPEPFVKFELETELSKRKLLPKTTGAEGRALEAQWVEYRRKLRALATTGGALRVRHHVIEPLAPMLGYARLEVAEPVATRVDDREDGGNLLRAERGNARLRVWATAFNEDLYAPSKRGRAYRYSHLRVAERVLLATGERLGLLTNGVQLMLVLSDPARPGSTVSIPLDAGWKRSRDLPDSFRLFLALASPAGVGALPDIVERARLHQARVTKDLRLQARHAVERFIQDVLDHPENRVWRAAQTDAAALARALWREGLVVVYRLLFILKGESSDDPARSFNFASTSLWRNTYSPSQALARYARQVIDHGAETGNLLEGGLRTLFALFERGIDCTELVVKPLGGALFSAGATPTLSRLAWGERAVAQLLDCLLWTPAKRGGTGRERVHYGALWVEDLGRVYEALLELEPGIATEPMCRLRRQKLEVVVPLAQGDRYRPADAAEVADVDGVDEDDDEDAAPRRGKKTPVQWIEAIAPGRFYLRVGLGRKASGSYYTPHSFVRFLVQETLGPQADARSPESDPQPLKLLELTVLDPAMGSGHFLVEACRFLGAKLYEACRLCDEKASEAERRAEAATRQADREAALETARQWRQRVADLPDPDDELVRYLPSRAPEGEESGLSQRRAEALCRRMVAVHCLYGADKNPLAVELAKLALWIEAHAEGMPLTFLDHRLVVGDSLTGPFWTKLTFRPGNPAEPIQDLFAQGFNRQFPAALTGALRHVRRLNASVGATLAEIAEKEAAKAALDQALLPFRIAAAAWTGGVMLGPGHCDDSAYQALLKEIGATGALPERIESEQLAAMIARGLGLDAVPRDRAGLEAVATGGSAVPTLPYDLTFPEVFYPYGEPHTRRGFNAVLGNPPWDAVRPKAKEFFASFDFRILDAPTKRERTEIERRLKRDESVAFLHARYLAEFQQQQAIHDVLYSHQVALIDGKKSGGDPDLSKLFLERATKLLRSTGQIGLVVPSAFHANEGATGVRRLYLEQMALHHCYSFENRRKLFEIDSRFKFAVVVAEKGPATEAFQCAFYLHDDEWLFGERDERPPLTYRLDFVRRTGGEYLSLLELRSPQDLEVAEVCFANGEPFGEVCKRLGIRLGRELHMTDDAWRFTPVADVLPGGEDPRDPHIAERLLRQGYLILHEGKTFWHYDDRWGDRPRYLVEIGALDDKPAWRRAACYYRLAFRDIARATDERTVSFAMLPASSRGETARTEITVVGRTNKNALIILATCNAYVLDYMGRLRIGSHVQQFILLSLSFPVLNRMEGFLAHSALRLTCNHEGYAALWREQVGEAWRETGREAFDWPVLEGEDARWGVRAAIDAVVAQAYGLSRAQYAHVLSTFNHRSYPEAPARCLAAFDELEALGLEAFTRKHDPYWDIPLNEALPEPVITLPKSPIPGGAQDEFDAGWGKGPR